MFFTLNKDLDLLGLSVGNDRPALETRKDKRLLRFYLFGLRSVGCNIYYTLKKIP